MPGTPPDPDQIEALRGEIRELREDMGQLKSDVDHLKRLVHGVLITLFVTIVGGII
ncbi:MAG: hypothetical protein M3259_09225 [Actinomycetota bacterium]|nr:hypothetical protein [Actinomycetota bacterium]